MYAARSRYHDMMGSVKDFVKTHNVPQDLAERVIDYVTSTWAITKGIDTAKVRPDFVLDESSDTLLN